MAVNDFFFFSGGGGGATVGRIDLSSALPSSSTSLYIGRKREKRERERKKQAAFLVGGKHFRSCRALGKGKKEPRCDLSLSSYGGGGGGGGGGG